MISPELRALKKEFLRRCTALSETLENGHKAISVSELRVDYLAALEHPTRSELEEELHLIAALSVVIDLVAQGWTIETIESAVTLRLNGSEDDPGKEKERIRRAHLLDRDSQLTEGSVVQFIKGMEKRRLTPKGWHSIYSLMRDGEDLARELREVQQDDDVSGRTLATVIQPYLQFVTPNGICEHTGLRTNDIWRYFRHTWVNSYRSVPGRSMMILVRDAAAPNHPVIGIAALGSSVVQQSVRDRWIGWEGPGAALRLENMPPAKAIAWLLGKNESLIRSIYRKDLVRDGIVKEAEIRRPAVDVLGRLEKDSEKWIARHRRFPHSAKYSKVEDVKLREWRERAEDPLFRSKRSKQLAKLLKIRLVLQAHGITESMETKAWRNAITTPAVRNVVGQLIRSVKSERVGINMMDITVCGAVAPYNHLLGGKLVCMLLTSPEVGREFGRRYAAQTSIIASAMRGRAVRRSAELVLLCTTSLYGSALSQYSRVKIPAEAVGSKPGAKIEYKELGTSEGFGSFHFSKETLRLFSMVIGRTQEARKVNSIFGEGVNPLMRKIRDAMSILGLPADILLRHGHKRVVYGVRLAENFDAFLGGFADHVRYLIRQTRPHERSQAIADYWRHRWLVNRLQKPGILEDVGAHRLTYPVHHGARVELPSDQLLLDSVMNLFQ